MTGSMTTTLITFGLIILIFYFLIIRPQKKKDKEAKAMIDSMKKGDRVVTIGGIHGTVVTVKETTVVIKVDDNARIEFTKGAVSTVVQKTTAKPAKKEDKVIAEDKTAEKVNTKVEDAVVTEEAKTEETK